MGISHPDNNGDPANLRSLSLPEGGRPHGIEIAKLSNHLGWSDEFLCIAIEENGLYLKHAMLSGHYHHSSLLVLRGRPCVVAEVRQTPHELNTINCLDIVHGTSLPACRYLHS